MKLLIAFCLLSFGLNAQSNIKPFIKAGYYQNFLTNLWLSEFELGGGAQFNDFISLGIYGRFGIREFTRTPYSNYKIGVISIEPSYRILSNKYRLSPVIAYDAGLEIANNGEGKYINTSNFIYYKDKDTGRYTNFRGYFFGKAKIMLSIRDKGFEVLLGATYSTYIFKYFSDYYYFKYYTAKEYQFGFGFETKFKYTFTSKKQKHNKSTIESN